MNQMLKKIKILFFFLQKKCNFLNKKICIKKSFCRLLKYYFEVYILQTNLEKKIKKI